MLVVSIGSPTRIDIVFIIFVMLSLQASLCFPFLPPDLRPYHTLYTSKYINNYFFIKVAVKHYLRINYHGFETWELGKNNTWKT